MSLLANHGIDVNMPISWSIWLVPWVWHSVTPIWKNPSYPLYQTFSSICPLFLTHYPNLFIYIQWCIPPNPSQLNLLPHPSHPLTPPFLPDHSTAPPNPIISSTPLHPMQLKLSLPHPFHPLTPCLLPDYSTAPSDPIISSTPLHPHATKVIITPALSSTYLTLFAWPFYSTL